jgi:hypothetical protein
MIFPFYSANRKAMALRVNPAGDGQSVFQGADFADLNPSFQERLPGRFQVSNCEDQLVFITRPLPGTSVQG